MTDHNTTAAPSTFADYWAIVLGPDRDAAAVVREFDLAGGSQRDIDEWLGTAEAEAWSIGKLQGKAKLEHHYRALGVLVAAATVYVVWGSGASSANVDGDVSLQPFTPWADRDLVGEEWVGSFMGATHDLETDDAVIGYRPLREHELREWRVEGGALTEVHLVTGQPIGGKGGEWNAYAYIEEGSDEREHLGSAPTREMAARLLPCDERGQRVGQLQRGEDGEVVNLP